MSNSIQQIFRNHGRAYLERFGDTMPANHKKTIHAICNCGTALFGQHAFVCSGCGKTHVVDGSCSNRHCPTCQAGKSDEWLRKMEAKTLPVNYFMVTFTVPQELRRMIRSNQRVCYAALFKAAADAMKKLAKDPRFVGCDTAGFTGILHTWTRMLEYHPHVHFIVPGGGINKEGTEWKPSGAAFFIHAKPLSKIFRAKFIELLKKEGLFVPPCVWDPDWVVDCRAVGNGKKALKYLAQYVFRVAIAPNRILKVTNTEVLFKYQRSGEKNPPSPKASARHGWRTCKLKVFEFMRRYLQHTLPHGFMKVRHYGFMSANPKVSLQKIRELICTLYEILAPSPKKGKRHKPWKCKVCGGIIRWCVFIPFRCGVG